MNDAISAAIEAEIARRLLVAVAPAEAALEKERAALEAARAELTRTIASLTAARPPLPPAPAPALSDDDAASTISAPTSVAGYNEPTVVLTHPATLEFIFNTIFPKVYSTWWYVLRNAFNADPTEFSVVASHFSGKDAQPHYTIRRRFAQLGQDGIHETHPDGNPRWHTQAIHVYYWPIRDTGFAPKRRYTHATIMESGAVIRIAEWP
jgi:hypothetical protein